jgi:hypothetical protein
MATGNVSAIDNDVWQLVSTGTPTASTTSYSVTGLTGYKKYIVIAESITGSATTQMLMRFNSSSTGYVSIHTGTNSAHDAIYLTTSATSASNSWVVTINDANSTTGPKTTQGFEKPYSVQTFGVWNNTSAITSIQIVRDVGTYSGGGTITIYGIAG